MELGQLPVIDWDLATKLAGNKVELAEEILVLLMRNLRQDLKDIKKEYKSRKYDELLRKVHKLHGALCYCGLPRLKLVITQLETDLKNNIMVNSQSHLEQLDKEVDLLLERYSHLILKGRNGSHA